MSNQSNHRILRFVVLFTVGFFASSGPALGITADSDHFQVIVNKRNPVKSISKADLAKLFLKKIKNWPGGPPAKPVDQSPKSEARQSFSTAVLGRKSSAVVSFWQQQIFAGRGVPPSIHGSDSATVKYVAANPTAVGYVSGPVTSEGVRVLTVR